jgi:lysine biosynthesis protein LysW
MYRAMCPDCGGRLLLKETVQVGDRVTCSECGIELEVLSRYPLDLDYVLDDAWEDDWGDDEDEDGETSEEAEDLVWGEM